MTVRVGLALYMARSCAHFSLHWHLEREFFIEVPPGADPASVGATLYYVPGEGTTPADMDKLLVEVPIHPRVVQFRGALEGGADSFVKYITIDNVEIENSAPTFMADWEFRSGGDCKCLAWCTSHVLCRSPVNSQGRSIEEA